METSISGLKRPLHLSSCRDTNHKDKKLDEPGLQLNGLHWVKGRVGVSTILLDTTFISYQESYRLTRQETRFCFYDNYQVNLTLTTIYTKEGK